MVKRKATVSNVYTPGVSDYFKFVHRETPASREQLNYFIDENELEKESIPNGFIDSWKMNRSYIEVLNLLGITDMDNHSMLEYIKKFNNYKDKQFSKSKEEDKQLPIEYPEPILLKKIDEMTKAAVLTLWLDF